jgi:predicted ATPase/class 3 adenylate cyclase/Tfp pilus assembly protein PilF
MAMAAEASFGHWLQRRRKALDLTQEALAQRVGCAAETLRKIEADARRPSRQVAERLADALELPPDERLAFTRAARAEMAADRLAPPTHSVPQAAFVPAATLPSGTVTFLFSDIERSTQLWEHHVQVMAVALARHDAILRQAVTDHGGVIVKTSGDGIHAVFARAPDALTATLAAQRVLHTEVWGATGPLWVRMALHTGVAEERDGDYFGPPLNRVARLTAAAHGGQILLSRATQELVRDHLPADVSLRDLGEHVLRGLSRPEQIFQLVVPDLPADFPALATLDHRRTNLLAQPTRLIGRDREVATVCTLLRTPDVRLLTVTGPGGIGKTRLALQVGAELLDAFPDGVYFVDLVPIHDPNLVVTTIAQTLDVRESGEQVLLDQLKGYLREKQLLLLLDNFEQVVAAASSVATLLAACPRLKVLVTSRAVLHLRGEKEVSLPPLALPDLGQIPPLDQLTQYAAVALFIARALDVQPDFAVTNDNALAVAEICARLDGLPLAIELAARRIKLFAPEALLAQLSNRLALLTGGARDLPERQQTLRKTIDWSYALLSPDEQLLFRRLAVFMGGWTLAAAEAVCNVDGNLGLDVLDDLATLVDHSLLRKAVGLGNEPRFTMLETIREYALERLAASGEAEALRRRHAAYFLQLAEQAERELIGPQQMAWLRRLDQELDNLRTALEWSLESNVQMGLQLASALMRYWEAHGPVHEGIGWLARLIRQPQAAARTVARAKTLTALGYLNAWQSEFAQAQLFAEEGLALYRELGDQRGVAFTLFTLGNTFCLQADYAAGHALLFESLALYKTLGDKSGMADVLQQLGFFTDSQDYERARAYLEESLALCRALSHSTGISSVLGDLGTLALRQGDFAAARHWFEESLEIEKSLSISGVAAHGLLHLGELALRQGDYEQARAYFEESLALWPESGQTLFGLWSLVNLGYVALRQGDAARAYTLFAETQQRFNETGSKIGVVYALEGLASLAVAQGWPARALRIFAWTDAMRTVIGERHPVEQADVDRDVAIIRAQLDEATFAAAWGEGRAMTLEQAIVDALGENDE